MSRNQTIGTKSVNPLQMAIILQNCTGIAGVQEGPASFKLYAVSENFDPAKGPEDNKGNMTWLADFADVEDMQDKAIKIGLAMALAQGALQGMDDNAPAATVH